MIPLHKNFINSCKLTPEETQACLEGGEKILESSGLKATGTQIKYLADSAENAEELKKL